MHQVISLAPVLVFVMGLANLPATIVWPFKIFLRSGFRVPSFAGWSCFYNCSQASQHVLRAASCLLCYECSSSCFLQYLHTVFFPSVIFSVFSFSNLGKPKCRQSSDLKRAGSSTIARSSPAPAMSDVSIDSI